MGETADQLREEIASKREDAAAKIDQIEAKVQEIPQLARDTVDASIQQARTSVGETVGQMAEKVSLKQQVEERPLVALGIAIAGGWLLGKLIGGDDASRGKARSGYRSDRSASAAGVRMDASHGGGTARFEDGGYEAQAGGSSTSGGGVVESIRGAARQAGLEDTLSAFTGALVGTLSDQLLKTIDQNFPQFGDKLRQETAARQRQASTARGTRTFGAGDADDLPTGSGAAYGTSGASAMRQGATGGAGTGPGEGTGLGYGTGASAGAYTGGASGAGQSNTGGSAFRSSGSSDAASSPSGS